jgi:predicted RNA-binding Zn-ribbon protein involved in translation (DUF1610 family)
MRAAPHPNTLVAVAKCRLVMLAMNERRLMAQMYAVAIRMHCPKCGEASAAGLAWAEDQQAFPCPSCGAAISPDSVEIRREVARVELEWMKIWEDLRRHTEPGC